VEIVASLSQGRTAAAQCGLFTHKSVPVIFEPPCSRHKEMTNVCTVLTLNLMGRDRIGGTDCKVVPVLNQVTCRENV